MTEQDRPDPIDAGMNEPVRADDVVVGRDFPASMTMREKLAQNAANVVLIGLLSAGLVGMYLWSIRGGPATASADQLSVDQQVDVALAKVNSSVTAATAEDEKIVRSTLNYRVEDRQVPVECLSGNPFVGYGQTESPLEITDGAATTDDVAATRYAAEKAKALDAVGKLKLHSVLASPTGSMALVGDQLVRVGQEIEGWKVVSIDESSVLLRWRNQEYTLRIPQTN